MVYNRRNILEKVVGGIKDPEYFLLKKYYGQDIPKGFRIELFIARNFKLFCQNLKHFVPVHLKVKDNWLEKDKMTILIPVKKLREVITSQPITKHPKKVFCPYCEKLVIPKRLHKLDFGDVVLILFTAGLWAIFLFAIYLFMRRCPFCNYSLRGFKPLSEGKKNIT